MKKKDLSALLTLLAVVFFGCGAALLFSKSRREPDQPFRVSAEYICQYHTL